MHREDSIPPEPLDAETGPCPDARLVQQLRQGDPEASHQFVRDYYPGVYHYLLYLTGRRETAEDLAQETFLQAWRRLETFDNRRPLRPWLHRIAHREFLQALRSRRSELSLEAIPEVAAPHRSDPAEAMELRAVLAVLPPDLREVLVLHYLEGHSYQEIAQIVAAPVTVVKHRLTAARAGLQRLLGEGDLPYLNEPSVPMRQWAWLPLDQMYALETRLHGAVGRWAFGPVSQRPTPRSKEESMERREFLRNAAVGAAGLMLPEAEKEVVDSRLTQKVTCAFKATALSDLCERLRADSGVHLVAGNSVADEKVTLFCEKLPLREVMRQLSRPFGYTWLRSGKTGEYRYELVQDLRSQLLEEELRNRDRNGALLALETEIERYRPYLPLAPGEALARSKTAPTAEKRLLETLTGYGWGPLQMYFRLSSADLMNLRAGTEIRFAAGELRFASGLKLGDQSLPPDVARGVLQSFDLLGWRMIRSERGFMSFSNPKEAPVGQLLSAVPEARALVTLRLNESELGQWTLSGSSGSYTTHDGVFTARDQLGWSGSGPYAVGSNPRGEQTDNASINARFSRDPGLRPTVTVRPASSCRLAPERDPSGGSRPGSKVTTADVIEALHRATGLPMVADYYTRLHQPEAVSVENRTLFDALNSLADAMRLRWNRDNDWLQFRSTSYYDDRLKEVPNRLLERWSTARRQRGALILDELVEIAALSDAQLDATEMAEGARECFGLKEWDLVRHGNLRPHLRYLAPFTPEQRQEAMGPTGLPLAKMPLAQQQGFISRLRSPEPLESLEELAGATLRVKYTQPGWFTWQIPGPYYLEWIVPLEPGPQGRRALVSPVQERTRDAALQAARRLSPQVSKAVLAVLRRSEPQFELDWLVPQPDQIVPTGLDLKIAYVFPLNKHRVWQYSTRGEWGQTTW
jgi:RNA polymerase sigma factor (sigma-70 family)